MGVFGMKNWIKTAGLYALVCAAALLSAMALSRVGSAVAVFSRETGTTVVVDAGHGGEDGGTLSCTGVRESGLNLEIALRVTTCLPSSGRGRVCCAHRIYRCTTRKRDHCRAQSV